MENSLEKTEDAALPEVRIILIGGRWAGKSMSANTILRKERFECGRVRTTQAEVRHEVVEGRKLIVVDAPGWSSSPSLTEIPEGDKLRFKLNASKCPPGPNVFLLVLPIDSAFSVEHRTTVEEHMKLLGQRVWRFTMVLFTCGDYLGETTIEQHIESEGEALKWLIERCGNRYHVFNNKDKGNSSQVSLLLEKIDEMMSNSGGRFYKVDGQTLKIITEKEKEVVERAKERQKRVQEQRQERLNLISDEKKPNPELRMILLGSRNVGKTSVGNTILGFKEQEDGKRTANSVVRCGFVKKTEITLVDTPGWWKGFPVFDTPEAIKEEITCSMFMCGPGPHIFLLVVDADASFNAKNLDAVKTHVELLGEDVWKHTFIVFTKGDWLGTKPIEEYIEGEGEALQTLVEQCGNRYHTINNKNANDSTQVTELLKKIIETVAGNGWEYFVPDEKIFKSIEEKRKRTEEAAKLRQEQVKAKRKYFQGFRNELSQLRIAMLGQKSFGKSASGNTILRKEVFATCMNMQCVVGNGLVAGHQVTVIDTPGWWQESSRCTEELDREIVRGMSLSPSGVHAVLLVIPLDLSFRDPHLAALKEHMNLFEEDIWKHTIVLFTHGDKLADRSVEEHIEREHPALRWLVDRCENKYHTINNTTKSDPSQVVELFEKIKDMVAGNEGRLFCPNTSEVNQSISEKFSKSQLKNVLKNVLKQQLDREYKRRELDLMIGFRETLLELQDDIRGTGMSTKPRFHKQMAIGGMTKIKGQAKGTGHKKRDEKEEKKIEAKISREIEKLDMNIMKSTELLHSSMDILIPDFKGDIPTPIPSLVPSILNQEQSTGQLDKVLHWLSQLQVSTNVDNQLTLNFSQTSGYQSCYHLNPPET
ncbi:GTPase IMAP family member 8 isoform X2 [Kryptolebias marmoratus]|uniref:GTPase IMAP family member 8-like n=1 Tax=Kryptolebias marmoratus TaxID=37003 RepID=A0A3Q2ZT12_KRYMA|nr:GTPase IMAP family member 8 isoform X2 [Kryptolebias marmoratus]